MESTNINHKNIFFPPGGILMWIVIFLELFTFGAALIAMVIYSKEEPIVFHNSRLLLNTTYGVINTLVLLTSGLFMALSVLWFKKNNLKMAKWFLLLTMLGGCCFLMLKSIEYFDKIEAGLTIGYNTFFTFYWMLTLFHVIHVIVGLVILLFIYTGLLNTLKLKTTLDDFEASAAFWHMCDLIWLLLFPIIYLIF
jgi:nitric oxide reductase NorE protein